MRYMGGKIRQSKVIVRELAKRYTNESMYIEPFCGAMGVAEKAVPALSALGVSNFMFCDASESLIRMWQAVVYEGWQPPASMSIDRYNEIKSIKDPQDPITAYAGFGMSFGGKWFGGLARSGSDTARVQNNQRCATLRKAEALRNAGPVIQRRDYQSIDAQNCLIYLDPPYANRTKAHDYGIFSHDNFWDWAEKLALNNNVLVTSFTAPDNWVKVHDWGDTVVRHHSSKGRDGTSEGLFILENQA